MHQRRYSEAFKRTVIEAIDQEGLGLEEACRRYDIRAAATVARWYQTYGRNRHPPRGKIAHRKSKIANLKISHSSGKLPCYFPRLFVD